MWLHQQKRAWMLLLQGTKQAAHLLQHVAAHHCRISVGAQVAPPCTLVFVQEEASCPVMLHHLQQPRQAATVLNSC
jgi:hypothetical protein